MPVPSCSSRPVRSAGLLAAVALAAGLGLTGPASPASAAPAVTAGAAAARLLTPAQVDRLVVDATAAQLAALLREGRVTSLQLVRGYLRRISAYEGAYGDQPGVNAVILRMDAKATAEARVLDAERAAGRARGPMHGIPVLVKDNYDLAGTATSDGSLALKDFRPVDDSTQVARLRAAGAVVIAKTNLHEFAYGITSISSLGGQTRNPFDQTRNPGGSSGGTGAGLAAGFGAVGMGSDTCGSIRIPAAQNSLVGLRPTLGLSSRDGIAPMSATQDVGGPIARSVTDVAMVLDATVGYDVQDAVTAASIGKVPTTYTSSLSPTGLQGRRLGVLVDYLGTSAAEQPTTALVEAAAADMAAQGATVERVAVPPALLAAVAGSGVIAEEFERDLDRYLAQEGARFPAALAGLEEPRDVVTLDDIITSGKVTPSVLAILRTVQGLSTGPQDAYVAKLLQRTQAQQLLRALFAAQGLDAVVYPTIKQQAVPVGESQPGSNCALSANTGFPALSLPAGLTPQGMPVGVELLGLPFSEPALLAMGYDYEQATGHHVAPESTPALS